MEIATSRFALRDFIPEDAEGFVACKADLQQAGELCWQAHGPMLRKPYSEHEAARRIEARFARRAARQA